MDRLPTPLCNQIVLCRQLFVDQVRQDFVIISPVHQVFSAQYPLVEHFALFARWTNAHGTYQVGVQLRNLDGKVLWQQTMDNPFHSNSPLEIWVLPLQDLRMVIPTPGKYEVALLASGQEVACDKLLAHDLAVTHA